MIFFLLKDAFSSGFVFCCFSMRGYLLAVSPETGVDDTETLLMMMIEEDVAAPCCCGAWGTYVRIYEDMTGGDFAFAFVYRRQDMREREEEEEEEEETVDRIQQNSPDHLRLLCLPVRPFHVR